MMKMKDVVRALVAIGAGAVVCSGFAANVTVTLPFAQKCQEKAEIRWTRAICVEEGRYIGWPTVCRLRNGDILAVFSGDRDEHICPFGKVQMVRSSDNGETWSDVETIADGPIDDRDAGIVQMPDGEIVVTYFTSVVYRERASVGLYTKKWKPTDMEYKWIEYDRTLTDEVRKDAVGYFRISSKDDGRTWSKPEKMSGITQSPHGPKLLRDGSLIIMGRSFGSSNIGEGEEGRTVISVWKSTDAGHTWTCLCPEIPDMNGENSKPHMFHEPDIVELADGTLLGQIRCHIGDHGIRQTVSKDGGKTWTPMRKTELVGFPSHLLNLSDGRLLTVYSRRLESAGIGEFAAISSDGGLSWDVKNEICLMPAIRPLRDFGYPSSCELPGGEILTVYYQQKSEGEKPCLMATKWRPRDFAKTGKVRVSALHEKYWSSVRSEPDVPRLPAKADAAFRGRVADLVRITPENAVGPETREWKGLAWRNERVHAQFVVWSGKDAKGLRILTGDLKSAGGKMIPAEAITARFVLNVLGSPAERSVESGHRLYGDILDGSARPDLPANAFRTAWLTITPPKDVPVGVYRGSCAVRADGGKEVRFNLELEVVDRTLPDPADWKFFLTIWQHPLNVALLHRVTPFSAEHFRVLAPLYRELVRAGQKRAMLDLHTRPWMANGRLQNYVLVTRKADGSYAYDYSVLDAYVNFARRIGLNRGLGLLGVSWRKDNGAWYVDETSGDLVRESFAVDSPASENFWGPLLENLMRHLREKGWADEVEMEMDELKLPDAQATLGIIRRHAPDLVVKISCDKPPMPYLALKPDRYTQGLRTPTDRMFPAAFWTELAVRAKDPKLVTTFYICNLPGTPNSWVRSDYDECQWVGLFSAAKGFSGFSRWSAFCWGRDPSWDASAGRYDAGERELFYPGGRFSTRWEMLRDSFENWEKIRILRETGGMTPDLEAALAAMNLDCVVEQFADEAAFKVGRARVSAQVRPVLKALDAASRAAGK